MPMIGVPADKKATTIPHMRVVGTAMAVETCCPQYLRACIHNLLHFLPDDISALASITYVTSFLGSVTSSMVGTPSGNYQNKQEQQGWQ